MSPEEYQKFKISLKETQEKSQRMIERMDKTIEGVRTTIVQIQENERNIEDFKDKFGSVMNQLAEKLAGSFSGNPLKRLQGKSYEHLPTPKAVSQVVASMLSYKEIAIVTGAGVSADSGIPTFRGANGLYSKKFKWEGAQIEPQAFITKAFYEKHPEGIWSWVDEIFEMSRVSKANKVHDLIDQLARALSGRGKRVTVVTQNIDDLHLKPEKGEFEYEACHGNVKKVRCQNDHLHNYQDFRQQIILEQREAKCPQCSCPLRPHVLFFDESYGQLYGGKARETEFPFVFVIGTSLSTGLCTRIAAKAQEVVEINPYPVIEVGKVYPFTRDTAGVLSDFLSELGESKGKGC